MTTLYLDFESFLIQPMLSAPPPVVVSYAIDDGEPALLHVRDPRFDRLLETALTTDTIMVAHNLMGFESTVMLARKPDWATHFVRKLDAYQFRCTQIQEKSIRIARGDGVAPYGLADCLARWGSPAKLDKADRWRLRYGDLYHTPVDQWPPEATAYSLGDITVRDLYHRQTRMAGWALVRTDQILQHWADLGLACMSAWGMRVDPDAAESLLQETLARLEADKGDLVRAGLLRVESHHGATKFVRNLCAAKARIEAAYAAQGRSPPKRDVTRAAVIKGYVAAGLEPPDLDPKAKKVPAEVLEAAADDGVVLEGNTAVDEEACLGSKDPLLEAYSRFGQAVTLRAKAERMLRAARVGAPVQAKFNVLVNTGRTSCGQGSDPKPGEAYTAYGFQVQNLPRAGEGGRMGVREAFCAREGYVYVSVDFDTAELRSVSQICLWDVGFSELAKVMNEPLRDAHIELGTRINGHFDPHGSDWRAQYAWGYDLRDAHDKSLKGVRNLAKGPGFGLWGGMGAERLIDYCWGGYRVELTIPQAKAIKAVWHETLPETHPYFENVKRQCGLRKRGSRGTLVQHVTGRIRGKVSFCDAANGKFQSLTADYKKAAMRALWIACYATRSGPLSRCRPVDDVHDEIVAEVPRDVLAEAGPLMAETIVAAAQPYCPDVKLTASPAAMYRFSKAAGDPTYTADGELIPYEETRGYKGPKPPAWNIATWERYRQR